jgi:hypothetical protein
MNKTTISRLLLLASFLLPALASAETVTLVDGTKVSGEVIHTWKGVYTVKTAQGEVELPKSKIKSISFETPVARAIYGSPEKTLDAWRTATMNGDTPGMLEAYALMYQGMVGQEIDQMDFKEKSGMIADVSNTKFTVKDRKVEKDKATLTVDQEKGGETRSGDIHFVLENGEWKMTP